MLPKIEMQLLLLYLLWYSEMLSQMISFNHFSCHLRCFSQLQIELEGNIARMYLQLPLQQWGAGNVYLLVLSSWKVNIAENPIAVMGL